MHGPLEDGQRNCPKHVEFHSKKKFEKLVHLIGCIIRICHNARSSGRWTEKLSETCRVSFQNKFEKSVHLVGFIIRICHDARSHLRKIRNYPLLCHRPQCYRAWDMNTRITCGCYRATVYLISTPVQWRTWRTEFSARWRERIEMWGNIITSHCKIIMSVRHTKVLWTVSIQISLIQNSLNIHEQALIGQY
jgi:hypothetical protein